MYFGKIDTRSFAALIEFADTFVPICAITRPMETKAAPARPLRDLQLSTIYHSKKSANLEEP